MAATPILDGLATVAYHMPQGTEDLLEKCQYLSVIAVSVNTSRSSG